MRIWSVALSLSALALLTSTTFADDFPLLVAPEKLGGIENVQIVDIRPVEAFLAQRIPGAVSFDAQNVSETRNGVVGLLKTPDVLAPFFEQRGLDQTRPVVLCGDWDNIGTLAAATRMFWVFEFMRYSQTALLDGGIQRWQQENFPTESGPPSSPTTTVSISAPPANLNILAFRRDVIESFDDENTILIDARPAQQFDVSVRRNEHIPGSANLPFFLPVDVPQIRFKAPADLKKLLYVKGATPEKKVIVHCATGVTSTLMYFAFRLVGHPQIANYDGSLAEWHSRTNAATTHSLN